MKTDAEKFGEWTLSFNASFCMNEYIDFIAKEDYESADQSQLMKAINWLLQPNRKIFRETLHNKKVLFRSRCLDGLDQEEYIFKGLSIDNSDNVIGLDGNNSKEPSIFKAKPGRNNTSGQSYLYLAEDEYTACCEVKPTLRTLISVAKFELKRDMKIINFDVDQHIIGADSFKREFKMAPGKFFTLIMQQFWTPASTPEEYKITQLISEQIRKAGYAGLCYRSSYSGKKNYTIFNSHESNIKWIESRVVFFHSTRCNIIDTNYLKLLDFQEEKNLELNDIEEIRKQIIKSIKTLKAKVDLKQK